jgi:hypothetical protein
MIMESIEYILGALFLVSGVSYFLSTFKKGEKGDARRDLILFKLLIKKSLRPEWYLLKPLSLWERAGVRVFHSL